MPKPFMSVETMVREMDLEDADYADGDNPGYFTGQWNPDTSELRLKYEPDMDPDAEAEYRLTEHIFRYGAQARVGGRPTGEVAYSGYFTACGGKSLISGAELPSWDEQSEEIRAAWQAAADAVLRTI